MVRFFVLLFVFSLSSLNLISGQGAIETPLFTQAQLLEEFDLLCQSLREVHPERYQYSPKSAFESREIEFRAAISTSMTAETYYLLIQKFLRPIGCGHLSAMPSAAWYKKVRSNLKLIPFGVFVQEEKCYASTVYINDSTLQPGMEILRINGMSIQNILQDMREIQTVDGHNTTLENHRIESLFGTYFLFLYDVQDTFLINYKSQNGVAQSAKLPAASNIKKQITNPIDTAIYTTILKQAGVQLAINQNNPHLAVLKLSAFGRKKYKKWQKAVFKILAERNITHLALDLRGNGGGYFPNGNRLLRYFLRESFTMDFYRGQHKPSRNKHLKLDIFGKLTRGLFKTIPDSDKADTCRNYRLTYKPIKKYAFKGQLYVITDGGTFSMASLVATKLKHGAGAEIVGIETGGGEAGSNGLLFYQLTLPHTGIRVRIPYYHINHKVKVTQPGFGVMPTIPVQPTLNQRLRGEDAALQKVVDAAALIHYE